MQADTWCHADASRRVGSGEKRHTGCVQGSDDIQFVFNESPSDRQGVGIHAPDYRFL
jgi:hypothetical protein